MKKIIFLTLLIPALALITSCNKSGSNDGYGRLVVNVTDAPFPMDLIESATVTITKVEMRKAGDGVNDGYPFITVSEEPMTFNLLDLRNGVVAELLDIEIPEGSYDLVRLFVDEAGVKVKEGGDYNLKIPSGQQTGIKIFIRPALTVADGLTSELLLDFDLSRSFLLLGNPFTPAGINGFIFKPVIRAVNNSTAGRIEGTVTDKQPVVLPNAAVWLKQDTIVSTAYTDSLGKYAIIGVPAGTYSIFATKDGYDTVSYEGIKVVEANRLVRDFELTPKR